MTHARELSRQLFNEPFNEVKARMVCVRIVDLDLVCL